MWRRRITAWFGLVTALASPILASAAATLPTDPPEIGQLIEALGDADHTVRQSATDRLIAIGAPARPQVLRTTRQGDPEQRARAAEILKKLPWHHETDPPAITRLMLRYGQSSDIARSRIIAELDDLEGGATVLLRLLDEEPADRLRWTIVAQLWDAQETATLKRIRELDVSADDPAALLLSGRGWIERDPPRGQALLRRAIDVDEQHPSNDGGILTYAFEELIEAAIQAGDFDEAAALLRRQVPRDTAMRRSMQRAEQLAIPFVHSPTFAQLMALHTYFGPLRGYEQDLRNWGGGRAFARGPREAAHSLLARLGPPPPSARWGIDLTAGEHHAAGIFLLRHKFLDAAELELRMIVTEAGLAAPPEEAPLPHAEVYLSLAQVAAQRKDDAKTAEFLERALRIRRTGRPRAKDPLDNEAWAEIHFRRARVAHTAGDHKAADARVRDLLQYTPANADLTLEMIEWLKQTSRDAAAKTLFDKVYVQTRARLDSADERDLAGMQNDLAWLCARADERLGEALDLATAAVEASPENSAFLDTLAEVHFRLGDAAEAVRLENKALSFSPGNEFMQEQLERFRAGVRE